MSVDAMRVVALEHAVTLGCKNGWSEQQVVIAAESFVKFVVKPKLEADGKERPVTKDSGFHVVTDPGRRFVNKQWVDDDDREHLVVHEDDKNLVEGPRAED